MEMKIADYVDSKIAWAIRKNRVDGYIEEVIGIHLLRQKDALAKKIRDKEFERIYKNIRNPEREKILEEKVKNKYNRGGFNKKIPEIARSVLHQKSCEEAMKYITSSSNEHREGICLELGECRAAEMYDSFLPYPTRLEGIFKMIRTEEEQLFYEKKEEQNQKEPKKLEDIKEKEKIARKKEMEMHKQLVEIKKEIRKQNKEYTLNFAVRFLVEADRLETANRIVEQYVSFIKDKAEVSLDTKKTQEVSGENKVRVTYIYHVKKPLTYNVSDEFSETGLGLMDIALNEIVRRKLKEKPGLDKDKVKKKLSDIYKVSYWKKFRTFKSLITTRKRKKLYEIVRELCREWIHDKIAEEVMKKTTDSADPFTRIDYSEINGSPYSSIIFSGPGYRTRAKILSWYPTLRHNLPTMEVFDWGEEAISETEKILEMEETEKWLYRMNKIKPLGTYILAIRYKSENRGDRNKILKQFIPLSSLSKSA